MFKEKSIKGVWKIIGEESEWLLNLLNAFKEDVNIPASYIDRFLHYCTNMTGMPLRCR